ncbi:MAG: hypothetical protein S4CHLAM45_12330 [Chlamydiales bacterium]|nr:hypothetical protein [Chlamydiales bacterium]MCH9619722.1 hypothetical protein [Chlamydiales bacterium]MCH9623328.1 hypothetical protein [Chlamydiales bacterium]
MEPSNVQEQNVDCEVKTHQESIFAGKCCSSLVVAIVIIGLIAMITCAVLDVCGHLPALTITKGGAATLIKVTSIVAGSLLFCILVDL